MLKHLGVKNTLQNMIDKIEPNAYENIGINDLDQDMKNNILKVTKIKSNPLPVSQKQHIREGE